MTAVCEQCEEREPMLGGVTCLPCWRIWWRAAVRRTSAKRVLRATIAVINDLSISSSSGQDADGTGSHPTFGDVGSIPTEITTPDPSSGSPGNDEPDSLVGLDDDSHTPSSADVVVEVPAPTSLPLAARDEPGAESHSAQEDGANPSGGARRACTKCGDAGHYASTCGRPRAPRAPSTRTRGPGRVVQGETGETDEQLNDVTRRLRLFDATPARRSRPTHGAFGIALPSTEPELVGIAGVLPTIRSTFTF